MELSNQKRTLFTAICCALSLVLHLVLGLAANGEVHLVPLQFPVLLCGLVCGWPFGLACGLVTGGLAAFLPGMLTFLPRMLLELCAYGLFAGLGMRFIRTRHLFADLYLSLAAAQLLGRVLAFAANMLVFCAGEYSLALWLRESFLIVWPGIAAQLLLLPMMVASLEKAGFIPHRY